MLKNRFRKYLPVVVDLETGGFDYENSAVLEIAITLIEEEDNQLLVGETHRYHIEPYDGLIVEDESLEFTKIKLNHPLRNAVSEEIALKELFKIINVHKNKNQVLAQIHLYKQGFANINDEDTKAEMITVEVLPKKLDEEVAALMVEGFGGVITKLTQDQADYINVPQEGPFKEESYKY